MGPAVVRMDDLPGSALSRDDGVPSTSRWKRHARDMSALRLHATQALAAKLGGFTAPVPSPRPDPRIFDTWFANIIRRRRPHVFAINPETLVVVILPLAPAATLTSRLPDALGITLRDHFMPEAFIAEHVDRLRGGGAVVKTDDRRMVGIMNERIGLIGHWEATTDDEWFTLADYATKTPTLAIEGPGFGDIRLQIAVEEWERTGVARIPPGTPRFGC